MRPLVGGLAIAIIQCALFTSDFGQHFEDYTLNVCFHFRGESSPPKELLIVGRDPKTYEALGLQSTQLFPRELQAKMIQILAARGAKKIVFDGIFHDLSEDDQMVVDAMKDAHVVVGSFFGYRPQKNAQGSVDYVETSMKSADIFSDAADETVLLNVRETFGVVRHFSVLPLSSHLPRPIAETLLEYVDTDSIRRPDVNDYINYYGPAGSIPYVSYHQVLTNDPSLPKDLFKGKYVFLGVYFAASSDTTRKDSFVIPYFGHRMQGVEVHATTAGNLLEQKWIQRGSILVETITLSIVALLLSRILLSLRPVAGFACLLVFACTWAVLAYQCFLRGYFLPGLTLVGIILPLIFSVSSFLHFRSLLRSYGQIESAMGVELHKSQ